MAGVIVDQKIFIELFMQKFPKVAQHLATMGLDPAVIVFQWFVCLFSYSLPVQTSIRVWDLIFLKGSKMLIRFALAIIEIIKDRILEATEFP